jgi:hypothetical protein
MDKLVNIQKQFIEAIEEQKRQIEREWAELRKEQEVWRRNKNQLDTSQLKGKIKLDVGGTIFSTSLAVLTSIKGTYFDAMFSGRWDLQKEEDGSIFIDRDPFVFRHILNFLRGDEPLINLLTPMEKEMLKRDADFYQINKLVDLLNNKIATSIAFGRATSNAIINGKTLTTSTSNGWANVIASSAIKGKQYWAVRVNSHCGAGHVRLGIADQLLNTNEYLGSNNNNKVQLFKKNEFLGSNNNNNNVCI